MFYDVLKVIIMIIGRHLFSRRLYSASNVRNCESGRVPVMVAYARACGYRPLAYSRFVGNGVFGLLSECRAALFVKIPVFG